MSERLQGRRYRLLLAHPIVGVFDRAQPNAIEITDLRITFRVVKTTGKEPNTAEITVTNLSRNLRLHLNKKDLRVILETGYVDHVSGLFLGDARTLDHTKEGGDWLTRIRCGDGERALHGANVNQSFAAGTSYQRVVEQVTKPLGLSMDPAQLAGKQFVNGYTAHGKAADVLDRVLSAANLEWSIQDGRLVTYPKGRTTSEPAFELSSSSGLIGSPEYSAPDAKTGKSLLKVRCLLESRIRVGGRVVMASESVRGTFKVLKVTHTGDTRGNDWYSDLECEAT